MNTSLQVFNSILQTFLVFGTGAFCVRLGMIKKEMIQGLTRLALDIFFPCLTFHTIMNTYDAKKLTTLWIMPAAGFGMMLVGGLLGILFRRFLFHKTRERASTLHHICAVNNYVFLPLIVVGNLWGEKHIALLLLMNVGATIGFWTIGIAAFTGGGSLGESIRKIFSINLYAVALALLFGVLGIQPPSVLESTLKMLGDMAVPFMLILTGAALYFCASSLTRNLRDAVLIAGLRLAVIPAILIRILLLIPMEKEEFEVCAVVAVMPAAAASVLVAEHYGGSRDFAGQTILLTTILSIATIPLWLALILT